MAFQAAPNCAVASPRFTLGGRVFSYALNFEHTTGAYDQAALDELVQAVGEWAIDELVPLTADDTAFIGVNGRGLSSATDLTSDYTAVGIFGVYTAAPVPLNVAFCVKFGTGFTGRSRRGRVYFAGWTSDNLNTSAENELTPTFAGAVLDAFEALPAALPTEWRHVLISRQQNGVIPTVAEVVPITAYSIVDYRVDTRKKRL